MSKTRLMLAATALAGAVLASGPSIAAPGGTPGPNPNAPGQIKKADGPTVSTTDGPVRGFVENGVNKFLGIPFAAPPVGDLRWMPPAPPAKHDLLEATEFADTCPQVTTLGPFAGPTSIHEDCLYLNVFTTSTKGSRPVIVWIYGGGNTTGESDDYDGSKLATGGPLGTSTVVVTMNYRVGLFGVFSQANINAEGHPGGNYGIMDIQASLRWVRNNIARFGGDPNNVTLGGQSAGSLNTAVNMISPAANGLFHRAIMQSPALVTSLSTAAQVLAKGTAFAAAANCSNAACLRKLSAARILQLQGTPNVGGPYTNQPFVDGTVIPVQPGAAFTSGAYQKMPVLGGSVNNESGFSFAITEYFQNPRAALTPAEWEARNSAAVKNEYPLSNYGGNPSWSQSLIGTDPGSCSGLNNLKMLASTNSHPVYGWLFRYQNSPSYFPQMPNIYDSTGFFRPLAYHTGDIQYLFPGYHGGNLGVNLDQTTGQPRELQGAEIGLSDQLVAYWTNFAATGNPNGPGVVNWPAVNPAAPQILVQDTPSVIQNEADYRTAHHCAFWGL